MNDKFYIMLFAVFLLSIIAIIYSCNHEKNMRIPSIAGDFEKYEVKNYDNHFFQWNEFIDKTEIIMLETNEHSLIGKLNGGIVNNNQIYIIDHKQQMLFCFDQTGKFIRKVGQRGRGPSEYLEIRDFCVTDDKIYILDFRKIHSFDKNSGKYIESWEFNTKNGFNPLKFFVFNKEHYFLWCSNPDVWDNKEGEYYRMREIKKGKKLSEYFKFEYRSSEDQRFYPCSNNSAYLKPIDGEYVIYKLSEDSLYAHFAIDFDKRALSPQKIEELRNSKERNAYFNSNYFKSISNILETNDFLYFSCVGPEADTYEGLINKKTKEVSFGRWDYAKSPRFFFSDGTYLYGYYEPSTLIENRNNGNRLNTCFDSHFNLFQNISIDENLLLVKVLLNSHK
jgi:hypothetical protein